MGKRSDFERIPRDAYDTPREAAVPLLSHLRYGDSFVEPCAGNGALVRHLEAVGMSCRHALDIEPRADWIIRHDARDESLDCFIDSADYIITNPPWSRDTLHPMIERFSNLRPTWLLFDADWIHTRQAAPFKNRLRKVVSVGRVKWIPDSPFTGKDNCAWHMFDKPSLEPAQLYIREAA